MDSDGIEPPHRDFQSPALPFELQVLRDKDGIRTHAPGVAVRSLSSLATLSCYGTWNRTKVTGTKILWATITPCRITQPQSTAIMSSIGTSR